MRGNVLVLTVCRLIWTFSGSIAGPYFSLYILALGGSPSEIGLVYALGGLAGLFLYPVGGYIADHKGRVKLNAIGTYIFAVTYIFFIVAKHWNTLAIGQFLQQMALFYVPAMSALMVDSIPSNQRGIGLATAQAIPGALTILAPYVGGYVISLYGGGHTGVRFALPICYTASLLLGLLVATIRLRFLKETLTNSSPSVPLRNIPSLLKASYLGLWESLKWMSRTIWAIVMIEVTTTLFVSIAAPFWIIYAVKVIGLTAYQWGSIMLLVGVIRTAMTIPLGLFTDHYGPRKVILLATFLAPIPVFLFTLCKTFLTVLTALIVLTFVNTLIWPAFSRLIADLIPRNRRGRLFAILGEQGVQITWGSGLTGAGFLLFTPATIGSLIGGYIYETDPRYPWFILALSLIPCLVMTFRFIREPEKPEL